MTEVINDKMPALYAALATAQGEFLPIEKNREVTIRMNGGGSYQFKYADLSEIFSKTRPALSKNGLAIFQTLEPTGDGKIALVCRLAHKDGGEITSEIRINAQFSDIKALGAQLSYLRRYIVAPMLGVAADDDLDEDGQEAGAFTGAQAAPTGKAAVQMPQRRTANQEQPRADQARTVQPIENAALATAGEFAYLEKKIAAAGIDWARAHEMAGIEFVPDTQLTKAAFAAIKAVL